MLLMRLNKFLLLIVFSFFYSCIHIYGVYSNFSRIKKDYPDALCRTNDYCNDSIKNKIVIVNGNDLKACLNDKGKCVLYLWNPTCNYYDSPDIVEKFCQKNQYKLYVILQFYEFERVKNLTKFQGAFYGIDTKYYKSNLIKSYCKKFFKDIDQNIKMEDMYNSFMYFENGKFIKSYESVYNLGK